jgi:RNA polymerase sigma-70 factor (sigma-E family)
MGDGDFEELYREAFADLFRTVYLIVGERQEALDLTQETFARAFERWRSVRSLNHPEAWLQRVAVNLAISWHRRRRRRGRLPEPREVPAFHEVAAVDPDLAASIRALTPAQRAVVVLRFYADRSVDEVASTLGKRPGTVRALTAQALARLRVSVGEEAEEVEDEIGR